MRTGIARWGNSAVLRLPKPIADQAGIVEGTAKREGFASFPSSLLESLCPMLLRAAARHPLTVLASLIVVLLGSGWLDPAPIVQLLDAVTPLVAPLIARR